MWTGSGTSPVRARRATGEEKGAKNRGDAGADRRAGVDDSAFRFGRQPKRVVAIAGRYGVPGTLAGDWTADNLAARDFNLSKVRPLISVQEWAKSSTGVLSPRL